MPPIPSESRTQPCLRYGTEPPRCWRAQSSMSSLILRLMCQLSREQRGAPRRSWEKWRARCVAQWRSIGRRMESPACGF